GSLREFHSRGGRRERTDGVGRYLSGEQLVQEQVWEGLAGLALPAGRVLEAHPQSRSFVLFFRMTLQWPLGRRQLNEQDQHEAHRFRYRRTIANSRTETVAR